MSDFSADLPNFLDDMIENEPEATLPNELDPIETNPYSFPASEPIDPIDETLTPSTPSTTDSTDATTTDATTTDPDLTDIDNTDNTDNTVTLTHEDGTTHEVSTDLDTDIETDVTDPVDITDTTDNTVTLTHEDGTTHEVNIDEADPSTEEDSIDATPIIEPADEDVDRTVEQEEPAPLIDDAPPADEPVEDVPVIAEETGLEDGVAGNHFLWEDDWFWQEVNGYCGPTAAAFLLNQFQDAGISNPEYMVEQAVSMGLMDDPTQGMYTDDLATLLTNSGLPAEMQTSNMDDLAQKLEDGYGIIACVDSGEIWGDDPADQMYEDNTMDHFLVVSEIDFNRGVVTLTDPGAPYGNGLEVPIDQFEDAWADSDHTMVVTTDVDEELKGGAGMAIVNATRSDMIR